MKSELFKLIQSSEYTLFFTGAGISTLSGIPDFRSANGIYSKKWHNIPVEEVLSIDCFRQHPELFYEWAQDFVYSADKFAPNVVHNVIAELEKRNLCHGVYTQNIDRLHQRAGSKKVYELHGSAATYHCINCHAAFPATQIDPVAKQSKVPYCPHCHGPIKPDIVFYGEMLDENLLAQADKELSQADLLIVLGSSLTVYPAAAMPQITYRSGGKVVIVNANPTQFDQFAVLRYSDLATIFEQLQTDLNGA